MQPTALNCPNCGGPLTIGPRSRYTVCLYCNSSIRLEAGEGQGESEAFIPVVQDVSHEIGEKVKQLILDGKRAEAIQYYSEQTGMSRAEAEAAVNQLTVPLVYRLTRQVTISWWAVIVFPLALLPLAGGLGWSLGQMLAGEWGFVFLALPLAAFTWLHLNWTAPKLVSTWVAARGAAGRARVLKTAVIRPEFRPGGTLISVLLEIQPAQGGEPFRDEETWLVKNESLPKVVAGNLLAVRYEALSRDRVFPLSPITVLEEDSSLPKR